MIDAIPASSWNSTALTAVRPPKRLVTPWASKSAVMGRASSQLALASAGREDALRAEDHHEHEDDPEDHPLVLCRLQLGGQVGQAVAQDAHAGVLQLVQPQGEA